MKSPHLLRNLVFLLAIALPAAVFGNEEDPLLGLSAPADLAQQAFLKTDPVDNGGYFGQSIAASGNRVVIGGRLNFNSTYGVFVFVRNGNTWTQQAMLLPSNNAGFTFGQSVAIYGDLIVVGAPGESGIRYQSGAAYIYAWNGSAWVEEAYVKASNPDNNEFFGTAVAISGTTVAVGAPREDSNATGINGNQADNSAIDSGAVYVFTRDNGTWSQQAYIKASNTDANDYFGINLAMDGDTLAVGAPRESSNATGINGNQADNSASYSGAVYVFTRTSGIWSQQAYLKASNTEAFDGFGNRLALSNQTLVIGATGEDSNATGVNGNEVDNSASSSGAAYVFTRNGSTWSQQAYLKASNTEADDVFGRGVAVLDNTIVVSATGEDSSATTVNGNQADNSASNSGAAYVFTRTGTEWSQTSYLKAYNADREDLFGHWVALMTDGILVGAYQEDGAIAGINANYTNNEFQNSGAVYVFSTLPGLPEIAVEYPTLTDLVSGTASVDFGLFTEGGSSNREFTIRNPGGDLLTLSGVTFSGTHAADFTVTAGPPASLVPATAGMFSVRFQPATAGIRSATLEIASNDADENPFLIQLTGRILSYTEDSDGDGLSDAAEFDMAALGFDWQVSQPELVDVLFANANGANLYRLDQVQALNVNTPLISRDPATGRFKLTLGLRKSTNLADEVPFPMTPAQTAINVDGELEFEFDGSEDAAFFRVGAE